MWDQMSSKSVTKWEPNENHIVKMWEQMRIQWKLHCQNVGPNENGMNTASFCSHILSLKDRANKDKKCKNPHMTTEMPSIFVALPTVQPKTSQLESPCKIRGWSLMLKVFYIIQFSSTHHNLHSINLWKQVAFYMSKVIGWNITW